MNTPKLIYFKDNDGIQRLVSLDRISHVAFYTGISICMEGGAIIELEGEIAEKLLMLLKSTALFIE